MILRIPTAIVLLMAAAPTLAEERPACTTYVGTIVHPQTIDAAISQLATLPKVKGEYETSEQFAARQTAGKRPVWPALRVR